ncbi:MAG: bifunctional phosphoribosylaminoimidazolecarboxamide formyltransferase/IMP cyclohydrolase [Proteobacteria bacterium]|nr:bifunctional phosphoribosylaminoimidazolecarboxamide formyltransferase/IMP cyclohydrolase [Pseudomonadota bacterium]
MAERKRTALISVSDKTGVVDFAFALHKLGYDILATGGTASILKQSELEILELRDLLQDANVMGGKLRLGHPRILAAILADRDSNGEMHELERLGMPPIDLVAVNLYPLSEVLQEANITDREVMEFLDVSACSAIRAAARNYKHVIVLPDPTDYAPTVEALSELKDLALDARQSLAAKAFHYTAYYDSTAAQFLSPAMEHLPDEMVISMKKETELRYGENPHQAAALYRLSGARPWGLAAATLLHGKPLNYEHYLSLEVATELVAEFSDPACAIVKHMNPAGAATSHRLGEAARLAYSSDPAGCTGGVAAFNREVDEEAARFLSPQYLECVVSPHFSPKASDILRAKKELRLITLPSLLLSPHELDLRPVSGGLLVQDKDNQTMPQEPKLVTRRVPTDLELSGLQFAWRVAKHAKTHAAVLARGTATLGIGCGQTSRMDALRLAVVKDQERHPIVPPTLPLVLATDGPISLQHILEAAQAGVTAIIQPGGSAEDKEAVKACESKNIAMLFTAMRHYRH